MTTNDFVFFYGGFMSQWYPSTFVINGNTYNTAEQFMMAMKAEYFGDDSAKAKILATNDPSEQKAIGRTVKGFDPEAWNAVSRGYVYQANMAKFGQDLNLKAQLLGTGARELVEASPYDAIWGIKMASNDPNILDKSKWRGTNWLGEVLMKVREDLK